MAMLTCPGCGSEVESDPRSKSSEAFCPKCDYPLFWARSAEGNEIIDSDTADTTLRRLPGAGGRQAIASAECPTCAELNLIDAQVCIRCGGPMVLQATPEPEPEVELQLDPEPEPEPEYFDEPKRDWRPWALLALLVVIAVVLLIVLLIA
jgi:hypothetical protein